MYRYFVFDMDGTLVDSNEAIITALEEMEQRLGLLPTAEDPDFRRRFIGPPLKESMMKYYGVTLEQTEPMTGVYRDCYMHSGIEKSHLFPGTLELMEHLRSRGCRIAIATLKQHQLASAILKFTGLDRYADHICLNLENATGDKRAMILSSLEALGCRDLRQAVMVGDSPYDGSSARDAGVDFIALACGEGFLKPGALEKTPHVFAADSVRTLLAWTQQH